MKLISSREVYRSRIFRVTEERAVESDGFEIERAIRAFDPAPGAWTECGDAVL